MRNDVNETIDSETFVQITVIGPSGNPEEYPFTVDKDNPLKLFIIEWELLEEGIYNFTIETCAYRYKKQYI